jgi:hypothetical protein
MVVVMSSIILVFWISFKAIFDNYMYVESLRGLKPTGEVKSDEGQPMPHDMNALMWYDL